MNYPIYLTNMNRLTTCKGMVEHLFKLNENADITIIDNASTYSPLLEWYDEIKNDVKIIRNVNNEGPWVFFYGGHHSKVNSDFYIYSDADLILNPNMPYNWQEIMYEYIKKYDRKASLVLRLDDIPDHYPYKNKIIEHQQICWYKTDEADIYKAITDMSFTMDDKSKGYRYESMRLGGNFSCQHYPWYIDLNNLDDEEKYYLQHINRNFTDALYSSLHYDYVKNTK